MVTQKPTIAELEEQMSKGNKVDVKPDGSAIVESPEAKAPILKGPWRCVLRPLGCKVIIQFDAEPETYENSTIIKPDSAPKDTIAPATVVAVGYTVKDEVMRLQIGNKVLANRHAGAKIRYKGEDYLATPQENLILIEG